MKKSFSSKVMKCLILLVPFLSLISCSYLTGDLDSELSKFTVPKDTKYIVPNSIFTTSDFKFLDKNGKELSKVIINIEGCSYMERDDENVYFLHYPITEKSIIDSKLPTVSLKYNLQSKKLDELQIPKELKDFSITSVSKNYNNEVLSIYTNNNPKYQNTSTVFNLTTNELIKTNFSTILDTQKIDETYYILGSRTLTEDDSIDDNEFDFIDSSSYELFIYNSETESEDILKLGSLNLDEIKDSAASNSLNYKLLVLNDVLHIIKPNGDLVKLEKPSNKDEFKLDKVASFSDYKTNSNSMLYFDCVKSNGNYAYINLSNSSNFQNRKYLILDKDYQITELTNSLDFNYSDTDVQLYNDKIVIFTSDQNIKSINNSSFYLLEFNLKTLKCKSTNLTYLYTDDNENETFIPSKLIDIEN